MDDGFTLPLEHKGKHYDIEGRLVMLGYIHQFHITIDGHELIVEFDEERNYRVIDPSNNPKQPDHDLLEAVVQKIASLHE